MHAKIHLHGTSRVLAVCDSGLLGKTLSKGKIRFNVSETFYGGAEVGRGELLELLSEHENINLVGEECVNAAIEKGLIKESSIIRIGSVPHAQVFKLGI